MTTRSKKIDWHYHVNRYESEFVELTCSAYCLQEGISRSSFSKYRKALQGRAKPRSAKSERSDTSSSPMRFISVDSPKTPSNKLLVSYRVKILGIPVLKVERYV